MWPDWFLASAARKSSDPSCLSRHTSVFSCATTTGKLFAPVPISRGRDIGLYPGWGKWCSWHSRGVWGSFGRRVFAIQRGCDWPFKAWKWKFDGQRALEIGSSTSRVVVGCQPLQILPFQVQSSTFGNVNGACKEIGVMMAEEWWSLVYLASRFQSFMEMKTRGTSVKRKRYGVTLESETLNFVRNLSYRWSGLSFRWTSRDESSYFRSLFARLWKI